MSSQPPDPTYLATWVGRELEIAGVVTEDLVRKYCATFDQELGSLAVGAPAPPLIHFCLCQQFAKTGLLGEDGHPQRGEFLPPVPLPRRMWAGSEIVFHQPLCVGDRVVRSSRIEGVDLKQGRSGTLCFVTIGHEYKISAKPAISELQTIVYREIASRGQVRSEALAPQVSLRQTILPTATLLFRYSALTFNAHRIHYDLAYARDVEGYPNLVVHGPLQATFLIKYATELRDCPPRRFSFRSNSPLFLGSPLHLNAEFQDDKLTLWTCSDGGPYGTTAEASW